MLWAQDFELCEVTNVVNDNKLTNIHETCFKCFKKMKILWIFQEDENQKLKKSWNLHKKQEFNEEDSLQYVI